MNKEQALQILYTLAKQAELPKSLTGNDAVNYINQIEQANKVIESSFKEESDSNEKQNLNPH